MTPVPTVDDLRSIFRDFSPRLLDRGAGLEVAAVATVIRQGRSGIKILFIHRAEDPNDPWSGHMAFPGGRMDPGDPDPLAAAVRETREEVGLQLDPAGVLGRLSDVAAVGRGRPLKLVVEPYVFLIDERPELVPNHEVADVVWVPMAFLLDRSNRSTIPWRHGDVAVNLPCYRYGHHVIWGLTFGMVDELVTLLEGGKGGGRWMDPRQQEE